MRWFRSIGAIGRALLVALGLASPAQLAQSGFEVVGRVTIEIRDEHGNLKSRSQHNTVTTAGKAGIADQILASPTLGKPTHMAVGTGTPSGTALGTELDRNALTSKTRSTNVVTMVGTWAAGDGTGTLTEAGIFDASLGGNMWNSTTFADTKAAADTLTITWTLTIS